jgi:hypothetical protein
MNYKIKHKFLLMHRTKAITNNGLRLKDVGGIDALHFQPTTKL